jgi:hypothetical protein
VAVAFLACGAEEILIQEADGGKIDEVGDEARNAGFEDLGHFGDAADADDGGR